MVTIRLSRGGTIRRPFYHIVATDHRNRRDGRYLERLGFFNPIAAGQDAALKIDVERVDYWVKRGAQVSSRVADLLERHSGAPPASANAAKA
jgi:small subunit ribosomal protein S16